MNEDEARMVQRYARLQGLAGEAAPVDQQDPTGEWRLYRDDDALRVDVTVDVLRTLAAGPRPVMTPPARGFVVPA